MTALLELEPRLVGETTIEPMATFDDEIAGLHLQARCVPTCVCNSYTSSVCPRSTRV